MVKQFEVGGSYFGRFICNYDTKHTVRVVRRTPKTIWVDDNRGTGRRLAVRQDGEAEYVMPFGRHSMAMAIDADHPVSA